MTMANKWGLALIAALLALCLCAAALAEEAGTPAAEIPATDTASAAAEEAQASADALKDALTALENARTDSRKQAWLDSLKTELDGYVESGKLTQEQADLILKYCAEQQALQQNGIGRGGKGNRSGRDTQQNGRNGRGMQQNGFGKGGRGRFGNVPDGSGSNGTDANSSATPEGHPDV